MRGLVVVLVACGSAARPVPRPAEPPTSTSRPRHVHVTIEPVRVPTRAAPRPDLAFDALMPDVSAETRWPLPISVHPALEPHFDIAGALAMPGVGWLDLCARGAQNRHVPGATDLLEYLRGWCAAANHDDDAAVDHLAPLLQSSWVALPSAVTLDLATILSQGDADHAIHALARAKVATTGVLDALAAFYIDMDRPEDARIANEKALDDDLQPASAARCHRTARTLLLASPRDRGAMLTAFAATGSASCKAQLADVTCRLALDDGHADACADYANANHLPAALFDVFAVYVRWPQGPVDQEHWWRVTAQAMFAAGVLRIAYHDVPEADELAVAAAEAFVQIAACDPQHWMYIHDFFYRLVSSPNHDKQLDARIREVEQRTEGACR